MDLMISDDGKSSNVAIKKDKFNSQITNSNISYRMKDSSVQSSSVCSESINDET